MNKTPLKFYVARLLCLALFFAALLTACTPRSGKESPTPSPTPDVDLSCDAFFFSMFPVNGFLEEDFLTYEGISLSRSKSVLSSFDEMLSCFRALSESGCRPKELYLGLDPVSLTSDQARELTSFFGDSNYKVFLKHLPISEWAGIEDADSLIDSYQEMAEALSSAPRVKVYPFFAQEWVIADPNNYAEGCDLKEDVSRRLFLYTLFSEDTRDCRIRPGEAKEICDNFRSVLTQFKSGEYVFPNLSGYELVFLGDSVFGNFTDRRSITGQIHDHSGAATYNCGWGGITASENDGRSFLAVLDALITQSPQKLPEGSQARIGLTELFSKKDLDSLNASGVVFILHYGINDYLQGHPVETDDPMDEASYCGAMRTGIMQLKTAFPKASILIIIPNHVFLNQCGTEIIGESGSVLEDYANALIELAKEFALPYQDDYHEIVNYQKNYVHLDDGIHPNDYGRFLVAYELMHAIEDNFNRSPLPQR